MLWAILYHDSFVPELDALPEEVMDGVLAMGELLMRSGPTLGMLYFCMYIMSATQQLSVFLYF